jgi:hypothetical protein
MAEPPNGIPARLRQAQSPRAKTRIISSSDTAIAGNSGMMGGKPLAISAFGSTMLARIWSIFSRLPTSFRLGPIADSVFSTE